MEYSRVILITGAREWDEVSKISDTLSAFSSNDNAKTLIIHGGCSGVDMLADGVAKKLNFSISTFPANWSKYGRAAGPVRNAQMVEEVLKYKKNKNIDTVVIAFHGCLDKSKGTKNCVKLALKKGIDVILII